MISITDAQIFAREWVESWNSHDLDRIMSHYSDDFEITSPFIVRLINEPAGTIKGKQNVRAYWAKALGRIPDLHFELIEVLTSVDSIAIYYNAVLGKRAIELLFFDKNGKVTRGVAHYNA
ncbi:MAG: nuclear transport factor 2 family protein [Thermodesulfobacteriota bacterium]